LAQGLGFRVFRRKLAFRPGRGEGVGKLIINKITGQKRGESSYRLVS
jgi:hypothetical protein